MSNVTPIGRAPSIRELAEQEVAKEQADKAKARMKELLRQRAAAESVVRGIDIQIKDLEQQLADGTY